MVKALAVTASQIIREIQTLPLDEQAKVVRFARSLEPKPQLSGDELTALAKRMTEATDAEEALALREQIVRGFYGGEPHAWNPPPESSAGVAAPFARPRARTQCVG